CPSPGTRPACSPSTPGSSPAPSAARLLSREPSSLLVRFALSVRTSSIEPPPAGGAVGLRRSDLSAAIRSGGFAARAAGGTCRPPTSSVDGECAVSDRVLFTPDGETVVPTEYTTGPWGDDLMHGGAVAALMVTALEGVATP